jgi:hypothetical protein
MATLLLSLLIVTALKMLSGACNAVMDTVDQHFWDSIFDRIKSKSRRLWWNEDKGWLNKYRWRNPALGRVKWGFLGVPFNKPVQFCDAWHFFKMFMEVFDILALCTAIASTQRLIAHGYFITTVTLVILFVWIGAARNFGFSLFYNRILPKPEKRISWLFLK